MKFVKHNHIPHDHQLLRDIVSNTHPHLQWDVIFHIGQILHGPQIVIEPRAVLHLVKLPDNLNGTIFLRAYDDI